MADTSFFGRLQGVVKVFSSSSEVSKAEEKQSISLAPMGLGPMAILNPEEELKKGLKKQGISFKQLRDISKADAIIRICINSIRKSVSQSPWKIVCKSGKGDPKILEQWDKFFSHVNSNGENVRGLLDKVLEDVLALDAGVIEKVYNWKGELMELAAVDGATIRPVYNIYGQLNPSEGYVQYLGNKKVASFKPNEIMYIMQNPQNDVERFGYGMSPIESIILAVISSLNADLWNSKAFSTDNIPPGMIDLGDMGSAEARKFIDHWDTATQTNNRKLRFIWGGKDVSKRYIPFIQNHKDMQFTEYTDWLARLKLATYGLTGMDANITQDVNRATAYVQQTISESRGVDSMKQLIEEYFYREVFMSSGFEDYMFKFEDTVNLDQKKKQADVDKIYIDAGVLTPEQVANREGFDVSDMDSGEEDYSVKPVEVPLEEKPKPKEKIVEEPKKDVKTTEETKKVFKPLY